MSALRWRRWRAVLLRSRGWTYAQLAATFGVSRQRAREIVFGGARDRLPPALRDRRRLRARPWEVLRAQDILARALWLERMRVFNRALAQRARTRQVTP